MPSQNIVLPEIGQVYEMDEEGLYLAEQIPTGGVLVDGLGIGDVGNVVLRDRKHLSQDGLIIVVMAIDRDQGVLVSGPDMRVPLSRSMAMTTMIRPSWLRCLRSRSTTLPTSPMPRPSTSTPPVGTSPTMSRLF